MLPLLLRLGFWQLARADEKQQQLAVYQQQQELPAIPVNDFSALSDQRYRSVILTGFYDVEHFWLLDNRSRQGKTGYEVLMPFMLASGGRVLVNRGWIQAPLLRSELPQFETPKGKITVEGYWYPPQENAVIQSMQSDLPFPWPKRVLQINHPAAEEQLQARVHPQWLRIKAEQPGALKTEWTIINVTPEKHLGYAVQWFSMAVVLLILYGYLLLTRKTG